MNQHTAFGGAEVTAYLKVEKKNGEVRYYKVVDGQNVEISEEEYKLNNK